VHNCRIIHSAEFALEPSINIFYGQNASGKSSILEALSLLARGRSFRTPRIQEVIHHDAQEILVNARIEQGQLSTAYPIGIRKSVTETRIRIQHSNIKQQAELSTHLPLTLIHPNSVELLTGSPSGRRAFLDWIAFYRFADFHSHWKQYQRVLKQRNACLRDNKQRSSLPYWTEQLIALQPILQRFRQQALQALQQTLSISDDLLQMPSLPHLQLSTGYPQDVDIFEADQLRQFLLARTDNELKQGLSLYGAHRADLKILLAGQPIHQVASRGQLKLLTVGLLLAQSHAISELSTKRGIIAIDDLAAELDEPNQQTLYKILCSTQQQLMITGTRPIATHVLGQQAALFQVHQGQVTRQV
jgi:DNA replication and repair protein RecF